ncbi:MAG: hypothetical protein F4Z97_05195, partial [Gammaproteobacteria bacterium]|nr:hypothetical protein [Gammaproteobacteria bacterium]
TNRRISLWVGIKISDERMQVLNVYRDRLHGEWNYTLNPRQESFFSESP